MLDTTKIAQNSVSISQFAPERISQVFDRLHRENRQIVRKDGQRVAVMLSPEEYGRLTGLEQDYRLLLEAFERLEKSGDNNGIPVNDVMRRHGISESELDEIGDIAIDRAIEKTTPLFFSDSFLRRFNGIKLIGGL